MASGSLFVNAQDDTHESIDEGGRWGNQTNWDPKNVPAENDTVVIANGTYIYLNQQNETYKCATLIVKPDGELDLSGYNLTVTHDIRVDGTVSGSGTVELEGDGTIIDGTGNIYGSVENTGDKTITDSTELSIDGTLNYLGDHIITNNGRISISGNLTGNSDNSAWINAEGSQLDAGGELFKSSGTLEAKADNNKVNYKSSQDIRDPVDSEYYHLEISDGAKGELQNDMTIGGNLSITNGEFVSNDHELIIGGDFINKGNFNGGKSTVIFNGTQDQSIQSSSSPELFYDLELLNGNFYLATDVQAENSLKSDADIIDTKANKLTLGETSSNPGSLNHISGTVVGEFERYISKSDPSIPVSFPVGTYEQYRPADILNADISTGGPVSCEFVAENPGNDGLPLDDDGETVYNTFSEGYWRFKENDDFETDNNDNIEVRMKGEGFTTFTPDESTRLLYRPGDTDPWEFNGTHGSATGDTAKRTDMNALAGEYSFGDTTNCDPPGEPNITDTNKNVCINASDIYYEVTNCSSSDTVLWNVSGGTINSVEGDHGERLYVDWGSTAETGEVEAVRVNDCAAGVTTSLPVNIHSMAPSSIDGPKEVAEGETGATYSVDSLNDYSYSWEVDGGNIDSSNGTDSTKITVKWGDPGTGTIEVTGTYRGDGGCNESDPVSTEVTIYHVVESKEDGSWDQKNTWEDRVKPTPSTSVRIKHRVELDKSPEVEHFVLASGGELVDNNGETLTVTGNYTNRGEHSGTGAGDIILEGNDTYINGTGSITNNGDWIIKGSAKTILSTTDITKQYGNFHFDDNQTVTNEGIITLGNDLTGTDGTWVNSTGATLNYGGPIINGIQYFDASANDNTVNYNAEGEQFIELPNNEPYYHLSITGTGDKEIKNENIEVKGDLTITSELSLINKNNLTAKGDWDNSGKFDAESETKVIFDGPSDGASDQTMDNASGKFYDLVVYKDEGKLIINDNDTVSNQLTMTKGNIEVAQNKLLTLTGSGIEEDLSYNSGTIIGAFERSISEKGTEFLFPVGTSTYYRPLMVDFNDLTDGSIICEFYDSIPGTSGTDTLDENGLSVGDVFDEGYWGFTKNNNLTSNDFDIDAEANGFNEYEITEDETRLLTRDDENSGWTLNGNHVNTAPDTISRNSVNKLPAQFGVAQMGEVLEPDIVPDDTIPRVCGEDTLTLDANISGEDNYTWEKNGEVVEDCDNQETCEFTPDNPGDEINSDGYIEVTFEVTVKSDGTDGSDEQIVRVYRRPETGNQYYVPNDFAQK